MTAVDSSKKCVDCGLIVFAGDEDCKRCGCLNFESIKVNRSAPQTASGKFRIKYLVLALVTEFFALLLCLPAFAAGGMRHSSAAPVNGVEIFVGILLVVSHLPSLLLTVPLTILFPPAILLTPPLQIAFFTWLYSGGWKKETALILRARRRIENKQ